MYSLGRISQIMLNDIRLLRTVVYSTLPLCRRGAATSKSGLAVAMCENCYLNPISFYCVCAMALYRGHFQCSKPQPNCCYKGRATTQSIVLLYMRLIPQNAVAIIA